ncbi:hemagglutinin repeat-containing protein [Selenomonas sputigena]|uniref:hemagglutinin repeat-containing protein n=1 Tax=Selenomonas sputigena TaxID=69823 RepID=UPI002234C737|nr:hemagglutinin repeat-containing protein [Selenomonas sputigena]UZE46015.1 hemagglutinin repeat-containing protein [Selenomonas sputigena]
MKNIELLAGENSNRTTSENEASSAGIGVSFSPQGLSGLSLSASKAQGNSKENASTYTPTEIAAKDTLQIKSGKDTNILGSTVQGNKVTAKIGGNLNIETLQEKETYEEKNTSAGFDLSWDIRAGKFSKPTFGLSAGRGTIDSHYRSARGQSGIFAGKGGFDIYVEKNTNLKGAVIASEAEAGKNRLSTGTFSFSDLKNGADYSSKSIGAEYHHYGSYEKMSRQAKNKVYNTIGLSPSLSMPAKGDANSTTTSAVAPGTIDIRKNPTQDISALSRDTNNALNELGRIFDKQKIEEQQELAKAFGEEAFRLAHNLPDDGSGRKVAVHAIIGGIMSQITGAGFASGAIGAGVNEAIIGEIKKIKDPGTAQIVSAIVGAAAAKAIGGNAGSGATSATSGTKNNHAAAAAAVAAAVSSQSPRIVQLLEEALPRISYAIVFSSGVQYIQNTDTKEALAKIEENGHCILERADSALEAVLQKLGISYSTSSSTDNTRHYILDSTTVTPWDTPGYPFMLHPYIPDSNRETYTDPLSIFREEWTKDLPNDNIFFTRKSEKEKSTDLPSWAKGLRPNPGESGKEFAKRVMDERCGEGNYDRGPGSDYNRLKKWGDRGGKNK